MLGWISGGISLTVILAAFWLSIFRPDLGLSMPDAQIVYPVILLLTTALAFVVGFMTPRWSISRQVAMWSAACAAAVTIFLNIHILPQTMIAANQAPAEVKEEGVPQEMERENVEAGEMDRDPMEEAPEEASEEAPDEAPEEAVDESVNSATALAAWTEVRANRKGHFIVRAEINNTPVAAMIDTGASAVALSHEDAERVGIHTFTLSYTIPVSTANGVVRAAPVTLRRVEVGGVLVHDVRAWVMPKGAMRGTLLGMSFLSRLSGFSVNNGTLELRQ